MAQQQTNIPSKSVGHQFFATELNHLVDTVNNNAIDADQRIGQSVKIVSDPSEMQSLIDAGSIAKGQLFKVQSDSSIRRYEGEQLSRLISVEHNRSPYAGYMRMVGNPTSDMSIVVSHNGAAETTGFCYSVNGGVPEFKYHNTGATRTISIPHNFGAPLDVVIWPTNYNSAQDETVQSAAQKSGEIEVINLSNDDAISLDVSGLLGLTDLNCSNSNLQSLNISGCAALEILSLSGVNLKSLDLSNLISLREAYLYDSVNSVQIDGLQNLETISLSGSNLSSINLKGLTSLATLQISDSNLLTNLNLSNLPALNIVYANNCAILSTVNMSGLDIDTLQVRDCPLLESVVTENTIFSGTIDLRNGNLDADALNTVYTGFGNCLGTVSVSGNPGIGSDDQTIAENKGITVTGS